VLAGLVKVFKNIWNPQFINEITYKVEKQIHGNPSGADNSTVVFGGLVWYRKEFEFLRSIWNLPTRFYSLPKVILADSGRPSESTKEMVVRVTKLSDRSDFQKILQDQEELVKKILLSLKKDDMFVFKKCLIKGERNLEKLQVVGKKALEIIKNIEKIGGAAKVCGAGGIKSGSGMILCYHQDFRKLVEFMKLKKYSYFQTELAGEGIRLEEKNEN
jgi:mevalonate kinase